MATSPIPAAVFGQRPGAAPAAMSAGWVIASLALAMLLSSLGTSIANVALPTLAQALHASFQDVQWVVLAYLLAITTLIVSVGRLGDVMGRRRLMLCGIVVFTAASIFCALAPSLWVLVVARAAQGLGAAIMMALAMALVGGSVPKHRIGSAMGVLGTMSAVGTALGPSLGGILIANFEWRAIFFINLPLGLLALVLTCRHLPRDIPERAAGNGRFDAIGTLLLATALTAYALAMTIGRGNFGLTNVALLTASLFAIGLFVVVEKRAPSPLIRLAMLRDTVLRGGFVMSALVTTVVMATLVVGPFYLSGALALNPAHVGLVMSTGPIVAALTGVPAGRLVDRFGAHGMTVAGLAAMAIGSLALVVAPMRMGIPGYVAPLALLTIGYALFQAANNTAVMRDIAEGQQGVASGMLNLSRNLGLITGASVMGALFAAGSGAADVTMAGPGAVAIGMRITFAVGAALIVAALAVASARRPFALRTPSRPR
jgi:EmrB/QacA subfamily drug resistance transporter